MAKDETIQREHPEIPGLLVRSDGAVWVKCPGRSSKYHWILGRDNNGYKVVSQGKKNYLVHRLVAETFFGKCPEGFEIDHIDRNRSNNDLSNLHYVTRSENRNNRYDVDRTLDTIGCHQREDKGAYNKWYASTEHGKQARKRANSKYVSSRRSVRMADNRAHYVPADLAEELLKLPVSQRVWGLSR